MKKIMILVAMIASLVMVSQAFAWEGSVNRVGNTDFYNGNDGSSTACNWVGNTYFCN